MLQERLLNPSNTTTWRSKAQLQQAARAWLQHTTVTPTRLNGTCRLPTIPKAARVKLLESTPAGLGNMHTRLEHHKATPLLLQPQNTACCSCAVAAPPHSRRGKSTPCHAQMTCQLEEGKPLAVTPLPTASPQTSHTSQPHRLQPSYTATILRCVRSLALQLLHHPLHVLELPLQLSNLRSLLCHLLLTV